MVQRGVAITKPRTLASLLRLAALRRAAQPQILIILVAAALVAYMALVPLGFLLWRAFRQGDTWTLDAFRQAYSAYGFTEIILNSAVFALGTTAISLAIGSALAYLIVRTDVPFKKLLVISSLVPLIIPGVLHTIAWIFLASPQIGLLNKIVEPIVGPGLLDVYSMGGMIAVEGLHSAPLVFLLMYAAFRNMDASLEESALLSGAGHIKLMRRVTLPLVKPAILASAVIVAIRALADFEVPALLGIPSGNWVFMSRIWDVLTQQQPPRYSSAAAYSIPLLAMTLIGVIFQSRFSKRARSFQTITGKGHRTRPLSIGRWRIPVSIGVLVYFFVAVICPVVVLAYASLLPYYSAPSRHMWSIVTLHNYTSVLHDPTTARAAKNSIILAVGAATSVMIITAIIAWLVIRTKLPGRWVIDNLTLLPLAIPGLVLGIALLFVYVRSSLPIYGTLWILLIAYFTINMPYGMRYASTSMYQIGSELEESAKSCGASWLQTFRRVTMPLLMPGLIAGWLYIVMVSVRELSSSILLYSPGREVLSVQIWEQWSNGSLTQLAALGMMMIAGLVVMLVIAQWLGGGRFGRRGDGGRASFLAVR